jgi:Predicted unusual protein kinase
MQTHIQENISVTDEGKLILYDYGMVGRINNKTRINLIRLYLALVKKILQELFLLWMISKC